VVSGLAGAGKSTMLAAAREAWEAQGYRVRGAALSGKAAEGLQEASGIESRTLASYERGWSLGYGELQAGDVFVVDEAGMVGSRQLAGFIAEAEKRGAKIVLVGDEEQLQAINGGSAFRAIADRLSTSKLKDVRRQKESWQREASKDFAAERTTEALEAYDAHGAIRFEETTEEALSALVRDSVADTLAHPEKSRIALAHRRVDIRALNQGIRDELKAAGKVGADQVFKTRDGLRAFGAGDRLMFLENNRELNVKNGMIGTVADVSASGVTVDLDNGRRVAFDPRSYQAFDHGYACTVHKAQGVTVDNAFVYATRSMDRHLAYVAMTRHRDSAQMYVGRDEMINMRSLTKNLSNSGVKATTLDFVESADQERQSRQFNAAAADQEKARVGWSMAMNVGDMAPEKAWAAMRNTAESADLLKEANGSRIGGRKCSKPVYHYSITWPSEDAPSDRLQKLAVKESLKELGLDDHEAMAVQHLDGDHPHVHVMVNLIHPETGMSASTGARNCAIGRTDLKRRMG
jgi:Ti-type conjugative transfer relaxase TraA